MELNDEFYNLKVYLNTSKKSLIKSSDINEKVCVIGLHSFPELNNIIPAIEFQYQNINVYQGN